MISLYIVLLIVAYLLGSVPWAVWIGKRFYGIDVREHGSLNAGTTNTLRILGRKAALPVFLGDIVKGYLATMLAHVPLLLDKELDFPILFFQVALSIAAVVGHMYPIFAGFKGGKGVATITGSLLAIAPIAVICSIVTFFIVLFGFNFVSLASMVGGALFPFYLRFFFDADRNLVIFGVIISILLIFTHRKNIKRLMSGVENKTHIIKKNKYDEK